MAGPCPAVKACRSGCQVAAHPDGHATAVHCAQERAVRDVLDRDAPEILRAGRPALRWPKVLAPPVDLLAHREAVDSNSVWEAPVALSVQPVVAGMQQAWPEQAQQKLHAAPGQARPQAASLRQEAALAAEKQADAPAAWQPLDSPGEKPSQARRARQRQALESPLEQGPPQVSIRRNSEQVRLGGSAQKQQVQVSTESQREEAVGGLRRPASCEQPWRLLLSLLYPLPPSVLPEPRLRRLRENARAP